MKNTLETLVILSPGFPANEDDTACMPPQQVFVRALNEVCPGLNVIVIAFQYPYKRCEYQWHGVRVISLSGKNKGGVNRLVTWRKAWKVLGQLNRQYQVMGLLSFWFGECAFVGSYFALRHGLSHYTWLLGQDAKRGNKYFNWVKPRGESLIALSDFIVREMRKNYGLLPAQVIPVGVDTSLFGEAPEKRDIDVLGAGSLIPLKQYHLFVETINFLKVFYPGIKAVLCGKGPEMENLKNMAISLGLKDNIEFAGELPHKKVLELMQHSKVFLHTSSYEGYGAVLSEALYAGAHVVSFCKPMDKDYRHHYVVKTPEEVNKITLKLLKNTHRGHDSVSVCQAQQVAKNMISLFAS